MISRPVNEFSNRRVAERACEAACFGRHAFRIRRRDHGKAPSGGLMHVPPLVTPCRITRRSAQFTNSHADASRCAATMRLFFDR